MCLLGLAGLGACTPTSCRDCRAFAQQDNGEFGGGEDQLQTTADRSVTFFTFVATYG